jgi:hypothetical protein
MDSFQNLIHRIEVGGGMRYVRIGLAALAIVFLTVGYNWRAFRNMNTLEAMDAAQLARNISEGKGYTTLFVRPLSIYVLRRAHDNERVATDLNLVTDTGQLKGMHPDLANPPVYPVVLAGLMKFLPFNYTADTTHPFWSTPAGRGGRAFWRYEPDFLISAFNQLLFFVVIIAVFFWARRLFEPNIAWLSAILLLGTELFWRFSVSGLSTMLLLLLLVAVVWCLTLFDEETREPKWGNAALPVLAGLAGLFVGLGALTRYSFGWLIIPVAAFVIIFSTRQRIAAGAAVVCAFLLLLTPWVVRNYSVCGLPFGTASYTVLEGTPVFPENKLQRSLNPDFTEVSTGAIWQKIMNNTRQIFQNDLPKLGGNWVNAFFLVGLLVAFQNPLVRRMRYFVVVCGLVLAIAQIMGRTQLSEDSPDINSENLLILLVPFILVYGASLFYMLLEQISFSMRELRYAALGLFVVLACLPMLLTFLPPKTNPVVYPYRPDLIQEGASFLNENELAMSDIPWGMAWYGRRQCVWLTLNPQSDFFAINDYQKSVSFLYLTSASLDRQPSSQWIPPWQIVDGKFASLDVPGDWGSWNYLALRARLDKDLQVAFPLKNKVYPTLLPNQLMLSDPEHLKRMRQR